MSSAALKRIALIAMVMDHLAQFIPGMPLQLRWVGRISAPVFLFVFVWSIDYTHDKKRLAARLYIVNVLMCIIDLAYNLLHHNGYFDLVDNNIFGTYFALFMLIYALPARKTDKRTFARYTDSPIYILDEPQALDTPSRYEIYAGFYEVIGNRCAGLSGS